MQALLLILAASGPASFDDAHGDTAPIRWEPFTGETRTGAELEGRLGRITVPERRGGDADETIELAFVVYESTNPDPGPPIYFLIGGPGGPGVDYTAEQALNPLMPLLEVSDVIGIDQRGTGHSVPNLSTADFEESLPLDVPLSREALLAAQMRLMKQCYEHWTAEGVDLEAYNSEESADDIDDVRKALGHDQIITWGTSYGSHLSLAYLRRHGEHVARSVVMKVEGPDDTFKLPSTSQAQLQHVAELVAADEGLHAALPDLTGTLSRLIGQLREHPQLVTLNHPDGPIEVMVGEYELQCAIALQSASSAGLASVPRMLKAFEDGELRGLGMAGLNLRQVGVESAMQMMMDYSSWASKERLATIERERKDPANLLGDALSFPFFPEATTAIGSPDLGPEFREPFECTVPTLFVSGDLDTRTPPANVEAIAGGFTDHAHILVKGTGHDARELESDAYRDLILAFLHGEEVESTTIELPPVPFQPIR